MAATVEASLPRPLSSRSVESVDSEYECGLMIEALKRELNAVRSQLAFLTHNLDVSLPCKQPVVECSSAPHSPTTRVTPKVKPVDKKVVKPEVVESVQKRDVSRYLEVVDQVEDQRWELRKKCLQLMQTHIEQQLHCLKEKGELLKRRLRRREKKLRAERLKLKPPRYQSLGQDDTSFLDHLPQSTFYQIVGEEHKLRKTGKLASLTQVKEFWEFMLSPTKVTTLSPPQKPRPFPPDEDEDETSNSWAITALPRGHSPWRKPPGLTPIPPTVSPSSPSSDLFKFVPGKLPEITPIANIFNDGQAELMEEKREAECMFRVQELTIERKRLRNIYQQARANEMAMRRLLPQLPTFNHSPLPNDVIVTSSTSSVSDVRGVESTKSSSTCLRGDKDVEVSAGRRSAESAASHTDTVTPVPSSSSDANSSLVHLPPPPVFVPLTMESAVRQSAVVVEPKRKSALWSNYIMTGDSGQSSTHSTCT